MFGKRRKKKQVTLGLRLHHASAKSGSPRSDDEIKETRKFSRTVPLASGYF